MTLFKCDGTAGSFSWPVAWAILACALLLAAFAGPAQAQTAAFTDSYSSHSYDWWNGRGCANTLPLIGREPDAAGRYPVFVYLRPSSAPYNGLEGVKFAESAASKGFVAASVEWDELWNTHTAGLDGNARCVYQPGNASAVAKLCARPKADCARGVVTAGFSLGSGIAIRARNHNIAVRAAYLLGNAEDRTTEGGARWRNATIPGRALPNDRIRVVNGVEDSPVDRRDELNDVTGQSCATSAFYCLRPDGSGWYVVQNHQLADGRADHCYHHGAGGWWGCSNTPPFDPTWRDSPTEPWALAPSLDWLKGFTG